MVAREAHTTEQGLAEVLLRCLSGRLEPAECIRQLEVGASCLFVQSRVSCEIRPANAIFEGIISFIAKYPQLKLQSLSFLLLLSLCSASSWKALLQTAAFDKYSELSDLLAQSLLQKNPYFNSLKPGVSDAVLSALASYSDLDFWESEGRLYFIPSTPLSIAISSLCPSGNEEHMNAKAGQQIRDIVQRFPASALEPVPSDNLPLLVRCSLTSRLDIPNVKRRVHIAQLTTNPATTECKQIVQQYDKCVSSHWLLANSTPKLPCPAVDDNSQAQDSYLGITALLKDGKDREVLTVTKKWMAERKLVNVAAAYVAAPNVLHRLVEGWDLCTYLATLPLSLRSPLDATIDKGLAGLASVIPELSKVLSTRTDDCARAAERSLRKIALIHPYIAGRRLVCFIAVCNTVLHGLTDRDVRYRRNGLHVLEVIFDIFAKLPEKCFSDSQTEAVCEDVLDFILEENRMENGVPKLFSSLAASLFKTIALLPKDRFKENLPGMLENIIKGRGTSDNIREGAENLLSSIREG